MHLHSTCGCGVAQSSSWPAWARLRLSQPLCQHLPSTAPQQGTQQAVPTQVPAHPSTLPSFESQRAAPCRLLLQAPWSSLAPGAMSALGVALQSDAQLQGGHVPLLGAQRHHRDDAQPRRIRQGVIAEPGGLVPLCIIVELSTVLLWQEWLWTARWERHLSKEPEKPSWSSVTRSLHTLRAKCLENSVRLRRGSGRNLLFLLLFLHLCWWILFLWCGKARVIFWADTHYASSFKCESIKPIYWKLAHNYWIE